MQQMNQRAEQQIGSRAGVALFERRCRAVELTPDVRDQREQAVASRCGGIEVARFSGGSARFIEAAELEIRVRERALRSRVCRTGPHHGLQMAERLDIATD
jgi:hypothetical protein